MAFDIFTVKKLTRRLLLGGSASLWPSSVFARFFQFSGGGTPAAPPVQSIVGMTANGVTLPGSVSFVGGTGSSGGTVATLAVLMSPATPAFSGTVAKSGTNASSFNLSGLTLTAAADLSPGTLSVTLTPTQGSLPGSGTNYTLTVNVIAGGGAFITSAATGTYTSSGSQWGGDTQAGLQFTVGSNNITVSALGRWVGSGNTNPHTLSLIEVATKFQLGSVVVVNMSGATSGQYLYGALTTPVVLMAGRSYYLMSTETSVAGDQLYIQDGTNGTYTTTADATLNGAVLRGYLNTNSGWYTVTGLHAYGPVNFQYTVTRNVPAVIASSPFLPWLGRQYNDSTGDYMLTLPVKVVSGNVTLDFVFYGLGPWTIGSMVVQWMLDNQPVGPYIAGPQNGAAYPNGPNFPYVLDTTTLSDGTHSVWPRLVDSKSGLTSSAAYRFKPVAGSIIVQNTGPLNNVSQVVPVHCTFANPPRLKRAPSDFVTFPGDFVRAVNTFPHPSPFTPPAYNTASLFNPGNAGYIDPRNSSNYYVEDTSKKRVYEYEGDQRFNTTPQGGVFATTIGDTNLGNTIPTAWVNVLGVGMWDGGRYDNILSAYPVYVADPDDSPANPTGFVGVETQGRIFRLGYDGSVETLAGITLDRFKNLPFDLSTAVGSNSFNPGYSEAIVLNEYRQVGSIGTPSFTRWSGTSDICYDPRDTTNNTIYAVNMVTHIVIKITGLKTAPIATLFAGVENSAGPPNTGSVNITGNPGAVKFNQPTSLVMDASGNIYVSDYLNAAIRKIDASGNVTTVCGNQSNPPQLLVYFNGWIAGNTLNIVSGSIYSPVPGVTNPLIVAGMPVTGAGVAGNTIITGGSGNVWTVSGAAQTVFSSTSPGALVLSFYICNELVFSQKAGTNTIPWSPSYASFTGTISGTTLTASAVTGATLGTPGVLSGIQVGCNITGPGVTAGTVITGPIVGITSMTYSGGQIAIVTAIASNVRAVGDWVYITGATPVAAVGPFKVSAFTNNQTFSVTSPQAISGTIGTTNAVLMTGGAGTYTVNNSQTVGPVAMQAGVVPTSSAYACYPQTVRFCSTGDLIFMESGTLALRRIWLTGANAGNVTRIAIPQITYDQNTSTISGFQWFDVDNPVYPVDHRGASPTLGQGACGALDDMVVIAYPEGTGTQTSGRVSIDGSSNIAFSYDSSLFFAGGGTPALPWLAPAGGNGQYFGTTLHEGWDSVPSNGNLSDAWGVYTWVACFSQTQARLLTGGFRYFGNLCWRAHLASDPDLNSGFQPYKSLYALGEEIMRNGTSLCFPFSSRPSLTNIHGVNGFGHLGSDVGPTHHDLCVVYNGGTAALQTTPATYAISSMTWSSTGGGQISVVMTVPTYVQQTFNFIFISGATNSGTGGNTVVNGKFKVIAYVDSQHFTVSAAAGAGVIGTIGTTSATISTGDATLQQFFMGGSTGAYPRPEFGVPTGQTDPNNDWQAVSYHVRRNTTAGSYPVQAAPGALGTDYSTAMITNAVATRLSFTSIQVTWTTDKPTIGMAIGGSAAAHTDAYPYNVWSPIESGYGTSHSAIITGLPMSIPIHWSVLSKDGKGNACYLQDQTIGIHADGTSIVGGLAANPSNTTKLVNNYGEWTFGAIAAGPPVSGDTANAYYYVLLNGKTANPALYNNTFPGSAVFAAQQLQVDQSGNLYAKTFDQLWYTWDGYYWAASDNTAPPNNTTVVIPPPSPAVNPPWLPSVDGSYTTTTSASVTSVDGVWTISSGGVATLNGVGVYANTFTVTEIMINAFGQAFLHGTSTGLWHLWGNFQVNLGTTNTPPSGPVPVGISFSPNWAGTGPGGAGIHSTAADGTLVSTATVAMSDGSVFAGTLSVSLDSSNVKTMRTSGIQLLVDQTTSGANWSTEYGISSQVTVSATQNGFSLQCEFNASHSL